MKANSNTINFDITKDYYDRNFEKIKQELQSYVKGMAELCGEDSEEYQETIAIRDKVMGGDLEELGSYLSEMHYAVNGEPEKYYGEDSLITVLISDLSKEIQSRLNNLYAYRAVL